MTLYKQDSTAHIFLGTFKFFSTQKQRLLQKYLPVNFEKIVNTTFNTYCLWNNVKERACYLEFSYVFFISKCSSLYQNNSEYSGGAL